MAKRVYRFDAIKNKMIYDKFYSVKDKVLQNRNLLPDKYVICDARFFHRYGRSSLLELDLGIQKQTLVRLSDYIYNRKKVNEFEDLLTTRVKFSFKNYDFEGYKLLRATKYCQFLYCLKCKELVTKFGNNLNLKPDEVNDYCGKMVFVGLDFDYSYTKGGYLIRFKSGHQRYTHIDYIHVMGEGYTPLYKPVLVFFRKLGFFYIELAAVMKIAYMLEKVLTYGLMPGGYYAYYLKDDINKLDFEGKVNGVK
jgi:hypothetical protein